MPYNYVINIYNFMNLLFINPFNPFIHWRTIFASNYYVSVTVLSVDLSVNLSVNYFGAKVL